MNVEKLKDLYKKYELTKDDVFKHKHYIIITRSGIEKIQGVEQIQVKFQVVRCEPDYAVFKAVNPKTQNTNALNCLSKILIQLELLSETISFLPYCFIRLITSELVNPSFVVFNSLNT